MFLLGLRWPRDLNVLQLQKTSKQKKHQQIKKTFISLTARAANAHNTKKLSQVAQTAIKLPQENEQCFWRFDYNLITCCTNTMVSVVNTWLIWFNYSNHFLFINVLINFIVYSSTIRVFL